MGRSRNLKTYKYRIYDEEAGWLEPEYGQAVSIKLLCEHLAYAEHEKSNWPQSGGVFHIFIRGRVYSVDWQPILDIQVNKHSDVEPPEK